MNQTPSEQMATFATAVANECKATRAVAESAKEISDSVTGTGSTWSSSKISSELTAAKNSVKNELSNRISTNANAIDSLEATTAGKVSFDTAQNLTASQKTQARANIGAASQSEQEAIDSRLSTAESNLTSVTATANTTKSEVASLSATVGTKANDNSVVKLDGNQTIAGTKTFSSTIVGSISGNAVTADSATKATQDGSGNVITSTYATKTELTNGLSDKANTATTLAGYGITNAYTKSQTDSNFIGWDRGALDVDTLYNTGLYMVASGKNVPSGSNYGVVLTMPYRQMQGNTKTDFGAQIFLPNGDDNTHPNSMFFRTSLGASWNSWQEAATTAWVRTFVSNALSGISGASVPQVGDIKLFHGSLGGSDGRRPVDGITGLVDEAWELCDGTNGTPDMRGQLAYGAGGTLAVGAAHGAPATSVDKAGFDYALGSRSGQPTTTVLTSTPQGVGLYYLKKTS